MYFSAAILNLYLLGLVLQFLWHEAQLIMKSCTIKYLNIIYYFNVIKHYYYRSNKACSYKPKIGLFQNFQQTLPIWQIHRSMKSSFTPLTSYLNFEGPLLSHYQTEHFKFVTSKFQRRNWTLLDNVGGAWEGEVLHSVMQISGELLQGSTLSSVMMEIKDSIGLIWLYIPPTNWVRGRYCKLCKVDFRVWFMA